MIDIKINSESDLINQYNRVCTKHKKKVNYLFT